MFDSLKGHRISFYCCILVTHHNDMEYISKTLNAWGHMQNQEMLVPDREGLKNMSLCL